MKSERSTDAVEVQSGPAAALFYNLGDVMTGGFLVVVNERSVQRGGLRVSGNVREDDGRRNNGSFSG